MLEKTGFWLVFWIERGLLRWWLDAGSVYLVPLMVSTEI